MTNSHRAWHHASLPAPTPASLSILYHAPSSPSRPPIRLRLASALGISLLGTLMALTSPAHGQALQPMPAIRQTFTPVVAWPDSYLTRLQAQALVQTLNAEILGSNSATLSLEKWCREHQLAGVAEAKVVATLVRGVDKMPAAEQRKRLQVAPHEIVKYRRVQLSCGPYVLSEADNWYVPGRLSAEMNRMLEQTDTPFGKVVLGLEPFRRTYAANVLWRPLPQNWEMLLRAPVVPPGPLVIPAALFEHRAVVFGRDLRPISEVVETYQRGLLAFPIPPQ